MGLTGLVHTQVLLKMLPRHRIAVLWLNALHVKRIIGVLVQILVQLTPQGSAVTSLHSEGRHVAL